MLDADADADARGQKYLFRTAEKDEDLKRRMWGASYQHTTTTPINKINAIVTVVAVAWWCVGWMESQSPAKLLSC